MHPGNRILIYILTALVIPGLSFFLAVLAGIGALLAILWQRRSPWRLLWRTRWLFMVLVLGYAYSLPGAPAIPAMGGWSPTVQGLHGGLERASHLAVMLLWLDVLVLSLASPQLLSGLMALARPFAYAGLKPDRFALRLALTLKVIESLEHERGRRPSRTGSGSPLRRFFEPVDLAAVPEQVVIQACPYRTPDYLLLALCLFGGAWLVSGAVGQGVHFDIGNLRPESAWVRGVNAHLPAGGSVLWAREVGGDFDARRSALERTYRYLLLNRPVRPALLAGKVGWIHGELDLPAMVAGAAHLPGTHDFSAFRAAECQAKSPIRDLRQATVIRQGDFLVFEFRANAFLHHQVRNMVGALVWVGLGRRSPAWVGELLASRDRANGAATFAADGLYLARVKYDPAWGLPAGGGIMPVLSFDP